MKKFKKLTAGLLGVVMAMSVCSFTALAANKTITSSEELIDAMNDQKDGDVWILNGGVYKVDKTIQINKNIIIEGNGSTIEFTKDITSDGNDNDCGFNITGGASEIHDLTIDGVEGNVEHGINVYTDSGKATKLVIDDVEVKNCAEYAVVNNSSDVTIKNIETSNNGAGINVDNKYNIADSDFVMEKGTIKENYSVIVETSGTKATIKGGEFKGIVGGASGTDLEITNGTFAKDVTKYMDENSNLLKDEDGNYVVLDDDAFEKSDKEFYISNVDDLKLAEKYQADGVTWVLADDIDVSEMILITTDITIDGDNHTMTFTGAIFGNGGGKNSFIEIEKEADVEVKDLTLDGQSYEEGSEKVKHGFNVYTAKDKKASKLSLNNVKIKNCGGYAIVNNASEVEVKDIETSGNLWGGINVDNAVGAGTDGAKFKMISGTINEDYSIAFENKTGAPIKAKIDGGTFKGYVGYGVNKDSFGVGVEPKKCVDVNITNGTFATNVEDFMDPESTLVKDEDGNFVIMDEEKYDKYLDSKRPTHSYELEEGRVDRDDEDKEEPVVTTKPEEEAGPFSDVGKDNPNYDAIIKVYEKGWMAGIGDGVFAPNGTLTRAMGAMVLWNKAGNPEPQNVAPFLDVTGDAWYAKAVAWAYEQGIIAGYDAATFGPDDALTTEQFTRMNDIATGNTPAVYVGGAPNATRGWVASLLAL